jgi:hypothetical protein
MLFLKLHDVRTTFYNNLSTSLKKSEGEDTLRIQSANEPVSFIERKGREVDLNRLSRSSGIEEEVTGRSRKLRSKDLNNYFYL